MSAKIISVYNKKGGVLKTTVVLHLGRALALKGHRVLLVDMDATQGNTTQSIGPVPEKDGIFYGLMGITKVHDVIYNTQFENLSIIPTELNFNGKNIPLDAILSGDGKEFILSKFLEPIINDYDYILIDTQPTMGIVIANTFLASNHVIIPCKADYLSQIGLKSVLESIEFVKNGYNHPLETLGILITFYDKREKSSKRAYSILKNNFDHLLFTETIGVNAAFKDLGYKKQTIFDLDSEAAKRGADNYFRLADEVIARLTSPEQLAPYKEDSRHHPATEIQF